MNNENLRASILSKLNQFSSDLKVKYNIGRHTSTCNHTPLPSPIPHLAYPNISEFGDYSKISNCVVTVGLNAAFDINRVSMRYPNSGRNSRFPASVIKIDKGTILVFTTGSMVTVGCETYHLAKFLTHYVRIMIECIVHPVLVLNRKDGTKDRVFRTLQDITYFLDFRVVNIVSNTRLTKKTGIAPEKIAGPASSKSNAHIHNNNNTTKDIVRQKDDTNIQHQQQSSDLEDDDTFLEELGLDADDFESLLSQFG